MNIHAWRGGSRCWIAYAVDNSVPRPAPDVEGKFLPMRLNATPYLVSTSSGDDALCIFSTEGRVIAYLREEEQHSLTASATAVPLDNEQDLRQFLEYYPAVLYVAVDPEPGELVDSPVAVEEFLRWLEN